MDKNQLEETLSFLFEDDLEIGFEMYLVLDSQNEEIIRQADLGDGELSREIKNGFLTYLRGRTFENPEAEVLPMSVLNEAKTTIHHYDLGQVPDGLEVMDIELDSDSIVNFNFDDNSLTEVKAFLIKFTSVNENVVLYKQHYNLNLLKQSNGIFIFRDDERFAKPGNDQGILRFSFTLDFLKVDDDLFIYDLKCLEREFNFNDILVNNATNQIKEIGDLGFVENIDFLQDLTSDKSGARKVLKLRRDSPVLQMDFRDIKNFVQGNDYLKRRLKFNEEGSQFHLHTQASRIYFIKLLNDDYLTSHLTNTQYDSENKSEVKDDEAET